MKIGINRNSALYCIARDFYRYHHLNRVNKSEYYTDERIVVIESDDWGSIRVPTRKVFSRLAEAGDMPVTDPFLKYDCLESQKDLDDLCEVLQSITGSDGRPVSITANFAMANADFAKIRSTNEYHRESIMDTYQKHYGTNTIIESIKKYCEKKVFVPQLHCLEHLNVNRWMKDIEKEKQDTLLALENNMYGVSASFTKENPYGYMDAFNYVEETEKTVIAQSITLAAEWFEKIFGKKSESFTASCLIWDDYLEQVLLDLGILHIQSGEYQYLPDYYSKGLRKHHRLPRRMAQKKENGIFYTIRNCVFEPSLTENMEWSQELCLFQVQRAFKNGVPAVISSHRINYVGGIDENNKRRNLDGLERLLQQIVDQHPNVRFMSSDALGRKICSEHYER